MSRPRLTYCGTCGAPMGPDGMIERCAISGEQCVECCDCCGDEAGEGTPE